MGTAGMEFIRPVVAGSDASTRSGRKRLPISAGPPPVRPIPSCVLVTTGS